MITIAPLRISLSTIDPAFQENIFIFNTHIFLDPVQIILNETGIDITEDIF